jgi:hypothetical protein
MEQVKSKPRMERRSKRNMAVKLLVRPSASSKLKRKKGIWFALIGRNFHKVLLKK